jgi:hypothetical protein
MSATAREAAREHARCALRVRGAQPGPPTSLLLCAAAHGQALGRAAVHRMQVEDAGLLEGHLAVARLMVYLRSRPRALCQGTSALRLATSPHASPPHALALQHSQRL